MVVVFGSFIGESDRLVKLFGVGLASAVLVDATIVRMLLVPATMELLGDANWWLPRWLDRLLPKISVEGHALERPAEVEPV
jgi:RND superfamily putative drug exporter